MREGRWVALQDAGPDHKYTDSIIACIVQVIVDPATRNVEGFCKLLRKDWFQEGVVYVIPLTPQTDPSSRQVFITTVPPLVASTTRLFPCLSLPNSLSVMVSSAGRAGHVSLEVLTLGFF